MNNKKFLSIIIVIYIISLCLPGIVYEASLTNNPKHGFCAFATNEDYHCARSTNGYSCTKIAPEKPRNVITDTERQSISDYCKQDWNIAISKIDYGYWILLIGWMGLLVGNFAWYANLIFIIAIIGAWKNKEKPRNLLIVSLASLLLGLNAFMFHGKPINEAGSVMVVDHLAVGYYAWMLSLGLFVIYSYQKFKEINNSNP